MRTRHLGSLRSPIASLAQAGSPSALIALGINPFPFETRGEKLSILVMCALKLMMMPAAFVLAELLEVPPLAAGVANYGDSA